MKIHLLFAWFGFTVSAWADLTNVVTFSNGGLTFPTIADRFVYLDSVGGTKLVGTNYVAGLWFVPGDDAAAVDARISSERGRPTDRLCRFRPLTTVLPGTWFPGTNLSVVLPEINPGDLTTLQVRVWDISKYPSFAEALAASEYGVSEPFLYEVPLPFSTPVDYYMDNLRAFSFVAQGPYLSAQDMVVAEGSNGVVQATFSVLLRQAQAVPVSVNYATQDGTALAGQDYVPGNGTVTFAPGERTKTVSISLTADGPAEDDETFYLQLSDPVNGVVSKARASCTITEVRVVGLTFDTSVSFNTVRYNRYVVERSTDAIHWEPVPGATNVVGTGEVLSIVDRGAGCQSMRAYRARLLTD